MFHLENHRFVDTPTTTPNGLQASPSHGKADATMFFVGSFATLTILALIALTHRVYSRRSTPISRTRSSEVYLPLTTFTLLSLFVTPNLATITCQTEPIIDPPIVCYSKDSTNQSTERTIPLAQTGYLLRPLFDTAKLADFQGTTLYLWNQPKTPFCDKEIMFETSVLTGSTSAATRECRKHLSNTGCAFREVILKDTSSLETLGLTVVIAVCRGVYTPATTPKNYDKLYTHPNATDPNKEPYYFTLGAHKVMYNPYLPHIAMLYSFKKGIINYSARDLTDIYFFPASLFLMDNVTKITSLCDKVASCLTSIPFKSSRRTTLKISSNYKCTAIYAIAKTNPTYITTDGNTICSNHNFPTPLLEIRDELTPFIEDTEDTNWLAKLLQPVFTTLPTFFAKAILELVYALFETLTDELYNVTNIITAIMFAISLSYTRSKILAFIFSILVHKAVRAPNPDI